MKEDAMHCEQYKWKRIMAIDLNYRSGLYKRHYNM